MQYLVDNLPLWLEVKRDIHLIGRYNTLVGLSKGEEVLLTNIFVDLMGNEALYDICFLAKRDVRKDRSFFDNNLKAAIATQEEMIEGSFYVESREEFDFYFKVIKQEE